MSKLSLDALKERAEAIASEELLGTISGGLEEACHDFNDAMIMDAQNSQNSLGSQIINWLFGN